jgi:hypothetical protein
MEPSELIWLKKLLPELIPDALVMSTGCAVGTPSPESDPAARVDKEARALLEALSRERRLRDVCIVFPLDMVSVT